MRKYFLSLVVFAVILIPPGGGHGKACAAELPDGITVTQSNFCWGDEDLYILQARFGNFYVLDISVRRFSTEKISRFIRIVRGLKSSSIRQDLLARVKKDIAPSDWGGEICRWLWEQHWEYRSPKGNIYRLYGDIRDKKSVASGRWVSVSVQKSIKTAPSERKKGKPVERGGRAVSDGHYSP